MAVTVEAVLPVHVLRLAVQIERHHRLLCVAAVVEQRIQIHHHCMSGNRISVVPSCGVKCGVHRFL